MKTYPKGMSLKEFREYGWTARTQVRTILGSGDCWSTTIQSVDFTCNAVMVYGFKNFHYWIECNKITAIRERTKK
jgi:hypothetical protein